MSSLIIANWKMNFSLKHAIKFLTELTEINHSKKLIIAPPAPYLGQLEALFPKVEFCAQDISIFNQMGAYTGEISAEIVKSCGINYSLIGHSERRTLCHETDQMINQKITNCLESGITPVICVGENAEARQNQTYRESILSQLSFIPKLSSKVIIAYEPIWSVGSGVIPSPDEISEIFDYIINYFNSDQVAKNISLVYGGSVNSQNYRQILSIPQISGVLLGGASLNFAEFVKILTI